MGEFRRLRRALAMAGSVIMLALGGVLVAEPAQACACGGAVSAEGEALTVDREVAALAWDGSTEDIVMQLDMITDADDAAVIIPTPSEPEVQLAETSFFDELAEMAAPRVEDTFTWWPQWEDIGPADGAGAAEPTGGVEVLDTVPLGPLEASVLSATDADGLTDWLREHEYVMSDPLADALTPYITEGWYFVAIRMVAEEGTLNGEVQPVHLSFPASSLIYPMRISAAAEVTQHVSTYVLADGQVRHSDPTGTSEPGELRYAGPVDESLQTSPTWDQLAAAGDYLTVIDHVFDDPAEQITSDFTFASAPDAADYQQVVQVTRMREIAGLTAGPVLLVLGLAAVVVAVLVGRRLLPAGDGAARLGPSAGPVGARPEQHYSAPR
ncbi:DUF2330 domain-containing protein [Ruania zhangjianzhongii]|uniref:DUF2330 domain-containing protein n=1 Tax=Ruania zhangjianzhongii TaxID=2603206 RepID=UPI00143D3980|nr:DUF2330 domain-containing protein [Ruania zhangjianzhongii]